MGVVLFYVHAGGVLFRGRGCFESPSIDDDVGDSGIGGVCGRRAEAGELLPGKRAAQAQPQAWNL
jgi:hypothetical protein